MSGPYVFYIWDDSCHLYTSTDNGATWTESATPGPGDPQGSTLLDEWADLVMAINDGDYVTMAGVDVDYSVPGDLIGVIGLSKTAGTDGSWTLQNFQNDKPDNLNAQSAYSGAMTAGAVIILVPVRDWNLVSTNNYPRISRDGGATWMDLTTAAPVNTPWQRAAFSQNAAVMYMKQAYDFPLGDGLIYKSVDGGATWNQLPGSPPFIGIYGDENEIRMRCSADSSIIAIISSPGDFWISRDGGATWLEHDFGSGIINPNNGDFGMTPDGSTMIVGLEEQHSGNHAHVWVSTDTGATWTEVSSGLPSVPDNVGFEGFYNCNVSPDGLAMVVTYLAQNTDGTDPDTGLENFIGYAAVSFDVGATWELASFTMVRRESGSAVGLFTAAYVIPPPNPPQPPNPPPPPFVTPKGGYIIERFDNRIWPTVENVWAVDCGFALAQPTPAADLTIEPI